jgi:hypothetical protein
MLHATNDLVEGHASFPDFPITHLPGVGLGSFDWPGKQVQARTLRRVDSHDFRIDLGDPG